MPRTLLTVQEAADVMGVSSSTIKRLCQTSAIPVIRTPGGHRRIDRMDLDRAASSYIRTKNDSTIQENCHETFSAQDVLPLLFDGKPFELAKAFSKFSAKGLGLIFAIENSLVPALWKVGQMWRDKQIDIFQEHICTNTALTAIDLIRNQLTIEFSFDRTAVGGSFTGCEETLASKLVALSLELVGIRTIDMGGALPPVSLAAAAKHFSASVVWVTHTHVVDVDSVIQCHNALRMALPENTRVIVGGGGLSPAIRRSLPWCTYYETISNMASAEATLSY